MPLKPEQVGQEVRKFQESRSFSRLQKGRQGQRESHPCLTRCPWKKPKPGQDHLPWLFFRLQSARFANCSCHSASVKCSRQISSLNRSNAASSTGSGFGNCKVQLPSAS